MNVILYFDGACEPVNPGGTGSFGVVIYINERREGAIRGACGSGRGMTNNVAEYTALEKGLRELIEYKAALGPIESLVIRGDSKLVVNQLTGAWRCNHDHLRKLRDQCQDLLKELGCKWRTEWVPREQNAEADALSVEGWETETGKPFPERRRAPR